MFLSNFEYLVKRSYRDSYFEASESLRCVRIKVIIQLVMYRYAFYTQRWVNGAAVVVSHQCEAEKWSAPTVGI
jgi:hypothetical protein